MTPQFWRPFENNRAGVASRLECVPIDGTAAALAKSKPKPNDRRPPMFGFVTNSQLLHRLNAIAAGQTAQIALLAAIQGKLTAMAHTLDEVLAGVADEGTKQDSLIALMNGVEQQLKDALAGTTLPPAIQAKVDAVFDGITNNATKVQAAIDANTKSPPAP